MARAAVRAVGGVGSVLLERERELAAFEHALDRVAGGSGLLLLVEGPAGIGKTRLLAEATERARARELLVRTARAGELERGMPYGVVRQLLEPVIERSSEDERSRLLAGSAGLALIALGRTDPARAGPGGDPLAPIHGLYWLLANLAESRPVVLVVDDAHWADTQSLRWLEYLTRRLADLPVLVVASVRSGEPGPPAELERLRLEAELIYPLSLSPEAISELIGAGLRFAPASEFVEACAKVTAGNPFLLTEVVRTLRANETEPEAETASAISELGPESVARYVLLRLGRFGEDAISLARTIAVLGRAPQLRHAAALAALDEGRARELCGHLRDAEILSPGMPLDFVHPLVRAAIYMEQSEDARSASHRQAAAVLRDAGVGAREIAPHLLACAPNGDQWVVAQLGEAALEAGRAGAHDSAGAYLERALEEPPEDELPLLYGLGRSMLQADPTGAREVLRDVAQRASDKRMGERVLRDTAMASFLAGDWSEAARSYAALLEVLPEADREKRLVAEAELFIVNMGGNGRRAATERIRSRTEGVEGTTPGECLARQALGLDLFMDCAPVDEVVALASSFPPHPWEIRTLLPVGLCRILAWSGRWDDARRATARFTESARSFGLVLNVGYYSAVIAFIDLIAGRLPDAEAEARTAVEIASTVPTSVNPGQEATMNLLATLITRGELEEAGRLADGIDLSGGVKEIQVAPWPLEVRGYLRLAGGELEAGVNDLLEFGEGAESWGYLNPAISWRQEAVPALAALDRTAEGEELIAVAERRARAFGASHVIGTVLRSRALIEPRKRQIETLRESVAALETYGPPHELARSLVELGAALRRDKQRSDSREPLRRALELASRCGADGQARRVREELAAAGSRPRSVFRTGVESLTASELRVAKFAAEGLQNAEIAQRLFVSTKTVEKHLGNVYTKLEIEGRGEIAAAVEQDGGE